VSTLAFKQQHLNATASQNSGNRSARNAGTDDNDVRIVHGQT
jgi:hypothetical protein